MLACSTGVNVLRALGEQRRKRGVSSTSILKKLIGWEYKTINLRIFRKLDRLRGRDFWCEPKGARPLVTRTKERKMKNGRALVRRPLFKLFHPQTHPKWLANHNVKKKGSQVRCGPNLQNYLVFIPKTEKLHLWDLKWKEQHKLMFPWLRKGILWCTESLTFLVKNFSFL